MDHVVVENVITSSIIKQTKDKTKVIHDEKVENADLQK